MFLLNIFKKIFELYFYNLAVFLNTLKSNCLNDSSNYLRPHGIVLIQYSKSKINEDRLKFSVFKSEPLSPSTAKRDEYVKAYNINI